MASAIFLVFPVWLKYVTRTLFMSLFFHILQEKSSQEIPHIHVPSLMTSPPAGTHFWR